MSPGHSNKTHEPSIVDRYRLKNVRLLTKEEEREKLAIVADTSAAWESSLFAIPYAAILLRSLLSGEHAGGKHVEIPLDADVRLIFKAIHIGFNRDSLHFTKLTEISELLHEQYQELQLIRAEAQNARLHLRGANKKQTVSVLKKKLSAWKEKNDISTARADTLYARLEKLDTIREEARNDLVPHYLPYVISLAAKSSRRNKDMPLEDLIDEGVKGLMKGIENFSSEAGTRLTTYATPWINRELIEAAKRKDLVRLPSYMYENMTAVRRFNMQYFRKHGTSPSIQDIVKGLGMKEKQAHLTLSALKIKPVKLRTREGIEDEKLLENIFADGTEEPPTLRLSSDLDALMVKRVVDFVLIGNQKSIVALRFGLDGNGPATIEESGDFLGLTRNQARRTQVAALTTMANWLTILHAPASDVLAATEVLALGSKGISHFWKARTFLTRADTEGAFPEGIDFSLAEKFVFACAPGVAAIEPLKNLSSSAKVLTLEKFSKSGLRPIKLGNTARRA